MSKLPTVSGGTGPRFSRHSGRITCAELSTREVTPEALEALESLESKGSILLLRTVFETTIPDTVLARLGSLGVQVIVARGFESRFYDGCVVQGILPVILDDEALDELATGARADPEREVTIDLERQTIERPEEEPIAFSVDPRARNKLLLGLTDLEEALRYLPAGAALREADRKRRPWLYDDPGARRP